MASKLKLGNINGAIVTLENNDSNLQDITVDLARLGTTTTSVATVEGLASLDGSIDTVIVKDENRGGIFNWKPTGTANGGTIFAGATGAWERLYSGAVNVKWFGAKGDGITDDRPTIQKALDTGAAIVNIPEGVYLVDVEHRPGGNYNLQRTLRPSSNQTVVMDNKTIIKAKPTASDYYVIFTLGNDENTQWTVPVDLSVNNVRIVGGTLLGERYENTSGRGESGVGILKRPGASNIIIEDVTAREFWGDGFTIGGNPIYGVEPKDIKLLNCRAIKNRRNGLSIVRADGVDVVGGEYNEQDGTSPMSGIDVEADVGRDPLRNVRIIGVTIANNLGYGLGIYRAENTSVVDGCNINNNAQGGVLVTGLSQNLTISGANIVDNTGNGVNISYLSGGGYQRDIKIDSSCFIARNSGHGVIVEGFARNTKITNSTIKLNGLHGIYVTGVVGKLPFDTGIYGNHIYANSQSVTNTYDNIHIGEQTQSSAIVSNTLGRGENDSPIGFATRYGINIMAALDFNVSVISNNVRAAGATGNINIDRSFNVNVVSNVGYKTKACVKSSTFNASVAAEVVLTIPHGLPYTPLISEIITSLAPVGVGDNISAFTYVKAVDATNVDVGVNIIKPSTVYPQTAVGIVNISRAEY